MQNVKKNMKRKGEKNNKTEENKILQKKKKEYKTKNVLKE